MSNPQLTATPHLLHSQRKQLTQPYIFISVSLYSWIAGLDDDIQWSELFFFWECIDNRAHPLISNRLFLTGNSSPYQAYCMIPLLFQISVYFPYTYHWIAFCLPINSIPPYSVIINGVALQMSGIFMSKKQANITQISMALALLHPGFSLVKKPVRYYSIILANIECVCWSHFLHSLGTWGINNMEYISCLV